MQKTKLARLLGFASFLGLTFPYVSAAQSENNNIQKSIYFLLRPRWEYVDIENNGLSSANAGTVRAQLGIKLKKNPLSFYIENTLVLSFYNNYKPQKSGYELVPDEPRYRITQLWVAYSSSLADLKLGRQVINLDNQRFVGAVNWRQTPQTFDAARVDLKGNFLPLKPVLTLAYICDRQGVTSSLTTYAICGNAPLSYSFLGHLSLNLPYKAKLSLYGYHFRNFAETYGTNLSGKFNFNRIGLKYWAEFAYQSVHNKVAKIWDKANYFHLKLDASYSTSFGKPILGIGYERLGQHFVTPLATLHKFNGWADVFLKYTAVSNTYGLNDYYLSLGFSHKKYGKILGVYHKFTSTEDFPNGGNTFGNEFDLLYTKNIIKSLNLTLKLAKYNADEEAKSAGIGDKDVTKAWIMLTYKFGAKF
jgi:hypothetical protein